MKSNKLIVLINLCRNILYVQQVMHGECFHEHFEMSYLSHTGTDTKNSLHAGYFFTIFCHLQIFFNITLFFFKMLFQE